MRGREREEVRKRRNKDILFIGLHIVSNYVLLHKYQAL